MTVNTVTDRQALNAVNIPWDRTLLASAKSMGEHFDVMGYDELSELRVTVPYAALEAFQADNQSRMYFWVSSLGGRNGVGFCPAAVLARPHPGQAALRGAIEFLQRYFW